MYNPGYTPVLMHTLVYFSIILLPTVPYKFSRTHCGVQYFVSRAALTRSAMHEQEVTIKPFAAASCPTMDRHLVFIVYANTTADWFLILDLNRTSVCRTEVLFLGNFCSIFACSLHVIQCKCEGIVSQLIWAVIHFNWERSSHHSYQPVECDMESAFQFYKHMSTVQFVVHC